jgi:hypothetical protein
MSTHITTIAGIVESKKSTLAKHVKEPTGMMITRFYGGAENGRMLQLTMLSTQPYIQLTQEQVQKLITVLSNSFDDTIYPSE